MKKLSDYIGQKVAVNCTTPKQAEAFCKLMHENGLKWSSGFSYLESTNWEEYKEASCYTLDSYGYASNVFLISEGYIILPATDFLEEEFVYGQEYEFSDCENFLSPQKRIFLCKIPNGEFMSWNNKNSLYASWKYCRKINTERSEAITKAKKLITKFDIKQEELFNN